MKIKTFTCHCSTPFKLLSKTTQPLISVHTKLSPILNKIEIETHKLTLHNNKKVFDLVIINNTTYNNKMTHSSYFTSMPTQPLVHPKKKFPYYMTLSLHLQSCNGWTFTLHTLHPPSPTATIHHVVDFYTPEIATMVFSCGLHKTKLTLWKHLCAWHGLTKNSKLCSNVKKAQEGLIDSTPPPLDKM
jgi:hypothetical protein